MLKEISPGNMMHVYYTCVKFDDEIKKMSYTNKVTVWSFTSEPVWT